MNIVFAIILPISGQCSHFIPSEIKRKPDTCTTRTCVYQAVRNIRFFVVFRGYKMRTLARNGLNLKTQPERFFIPVHSRK